MTFADSDTRACFESGIDPLTHGTWGRENTEIIRNLDTMRPHRIETPIHSRSIVSSEWGRPHARVFAFTSYQGR